MPEQSPSATIFEPLVRKVELRFGQLVGAIVFGNLITAALVGIFIALITAK